MGDVERTMIFYPDVTFRYTVTPSEKISTSPIPLDFSKAHLDKCMEVGTKDALKAIELGEGGYHNVVLDHFRQMEEGKRPDLSAMLNEALK